MKVPVGAIVLLTLAGLFWIAMMGSFSGYPDTDAAGRGLALGFGTLFGGALWLVLAALLIRAAVLGTLTIWTGIAAVVCLVTSLIGAFSVVDLYVLRLSWPLAVLALLPALVVAYALWPRLPLAGLIVVLSAVPLVATAMKVGQPTPQDLARQQKQFLEEEAARRKLAEDFAKLGPDSSLSDYLPFVSGDYSTAAREGMRKVKSRQADAVALLNADRLGDLAGLLEYDVQATPELCAAYRTAIARAAASLDLKPQRPNMEWLNSEGCDVASPRSR